MKNREKINQKGAISIILAVLLLAQVLVIGVGISILILQQIRMSSQASISVVAFYAADSGAEKCLYQARKETGAECGTLGGDGGSIIDESIGVGNLVASYTAVFDGINTITSIGQVRGISRKVELTW